MLGDIASGAVQAFFDDLAQDGLDSQSTRDDVLRVWTNACTKTVQAAELTTAPAHR